MPTTRLRFVAFMTPSGHRVRESTSVAHDTEFTVTRWVGFGHAQARASRELRGALAGAIVTIPALYMAGDRDLVVSFPGTDPLLANLKTFVPALRKIQMMPVCGHWTQQEWSNELSSAIIDFLRNPPS
jgi:pimeloyl-ACP methyl ester carboxylesterase